MTPIPDAAFLTVEGYLDAVPTAGDPHGTTARFRVISSPTDDIEDEAIWACTTGDPRIAHALLSELQPGDLLRISGYLVVPDTPDSPTRLSVDAIEVLQTSPILVESGMVLAENGVYVLIYDSQTDQVPVFTTNGAWVGTAESAADVSSLIAVYENRDPAPRENGRGDAS